MVNNMNYKVRNFLEIATLFSNTTFLNLKICQITQSKMLEAIKVIIHKVPHWKCIRTFHWWKGILKLAHDFAKKEFLASVETGNFKTHLYIKIIQTSNSD